MFDLQCVSTDGCGWAPLLAWMCHPWPDSLDPEVTGEYVVVSHVLLKREQKQVDGIVWGVLEGWKEVVKLEAQT